MEQASGGPDLASHAGWHWEAQEEDPVDGGKCTHSWKESLWGAAEGGGDSTQGQVTGGPDPEEQQGLRPPWPARGDRRGLWTKSEMGLWC